MTGKGGGMGGQMHLARARKHLVVWVNGKRYEVCGLHPRETTLAWLRKQGLTGTKLGCGEGGCGACTVVVTRRGRSGELEHASVNACLTPLCALDACSITTVEGLGSTRGGLHVVQQRLAEFHGSQCGMCTPGFVMALYALVENGETGLEHKLDGNLCRCTGYRPILDAAKALDPGYSRTAPCASGSCGEIEDCHASCTGSKLAAIGASAKDGSRRPAVDNFPSELVEGSLARDWLVVEAESCAWYRPPSLAILLALKKEHGLAAKLVCGNTEVGIEHKFKHKRYQVLVGLSAVVELAGVTETAEYVEVGGAATLAELDAFASASPDRGCRAVREMLAWFASRQIRNVASLAGNVATASPISDMNPMLVAMDAVVVAASADRGERLIKVREFFKSYRTVALEVDEVIAAIRLPKVVSRFEYVSPFKQARRREDDISIVTSGMRVRLEPAAEAWLVTGAWIGLGGMAPTTVAATATETFLVGKPWSRETLVAAVDILASETRLPVNVPGGMPEYRSTLCASFLHKFFVQVCVALADDVAEDESSLPPVPAIEDREISAAVTFLNAERPVSEGYQRWPKQDGIALDPSFDEEKKRAPVGEPLAHLSAFKQVTGEAKYADDHLPKPTDDCLHAALVLTTVARGRLSRVDASKALACPGVVGYYSAADVRGDNAIGAVVKDEECFVTETVTSVGQPIGIVVAESQDAALDAARLVEVDYDVDASDPPVLSIDDAIAAKSYFGAPHTIVDGASFDEAVARCDDALVVEGETYLGGQEHWYLECNSSVCFPLEDGGMKVVSSTQNPAKTQAFVASVLGVPASRVSCSVGRMGGGFGGKETRSVFVCAALAVAADAIGRPVKLTLDRDVDMAITGTRHAFKGVYRVAARRSTGELVALDVELFANAGYSFDLSQAVVDRAVLHSDNSYKFPNLRAIGYCCKTNIASNTAFRGFGGPQGMFVCETALDHVAAALEMPSHELRRRNLYAVGDLTHYHQRLEPQIDLPSLWDRCLAESDYAARVDAVAEYNATHRWRKRGLAMVPTKFGISFTAKFLNQGGALVHVYGADGSVLVSHGGTEMGQGLHTKVIQATARAFGIPVAKVHIEETATDKVANSSPSAASLSTDLYVMATLDACRQIIERLKPIRAQLPPDAPFETVVKKAYFSRVNLSAQGFYIVPGDRCGYDFAAPVPPGADNSARGQPFNYFTSGVAAAEVEVDILTGDAHARRVDVYMDLGCSINPAIDVGQIEGAFAQGFGLFCLEEIVIGDPKTHSWVRPGHFFTKGPGAYKIPAANDTPIDFRVALVNNPNAFAVHSSRAVGEPPLFLGSVAYFALKDAITSARRDAGLTGHFVVDAPLTPERIRMACVDDYTKLFCTTSDNFRAKGSF